MTRAPLPHPAALWRRLAAEFLGSAFLAAIVIGSGIAAQRLSPSATGLELLENSAATAAGLFAQSAPAPTTTQSTSSTPVPPDIAVANGLGCRKTGVQTCGLR